MSLLRDASGRLHIDTPLMAESLVDKVLLDSTETDAVFRPLPDLNVVKLGGQSIIDRGRAVLLPLLDEVVAARDAGHQLLVTTGGGTRSRHAYTIALDLGMPTGVLAKLGASISEQNALMVSLLLAPHGGVKIGHDDLVKLPAYLALGTIPVMHAMPPYGLWEEPAARGRIPPHRTDVGAFLTAEVMGAKRCVLVNHERGLFTADPKKDPDARFIPDIEVDDLMALDLSDLVVERALLQALARARSVREVLIVNGRESGTLTRALAGDQSVGTRIYRQ
ncbi:MAG: uridine kinase [Chloroflexi bacterium]|nr:uridine kinase [Chloroflexota bacterium]MBU1746610.1 uridine kinase [Chloroflexota bacterium]MBU1879230.1 uridine kinase [Chloroflexota bacterium]